MIGDGISTSRENGSVRIAWDEPPQSSVSLIVKSRSSVGVCVQSIINARKHMVRKQTDVLRLEG